jgi:excinuclease UvrABC ATPase subunit
VVEGLKKPNTEVAEGAENGEERRPRSAAVRASAYGHTLYILDEPTTGPAL